MVAGDKFSVAVYPLSVNTTNHTSNNLRLVDTHTSKRQQKAEALMACAFFVFKIVKGSNTISLLICRVAWYEKYHQ